MTQRHAHSSSLGTDILRGTTLCSWDDPNDVFSEEQLAKLADCLEVSARKEELDSALQRSRRVYKQHLKIYNNHAAESIAFKNTHASRRPSKIQGTLKHECQYLLKYYTSGKTGIPEGISESTVDHIDILLLKKYKKGTSMLKYVSFDMPKRDELIQLISEIIFPEETGTDYAAEKCAIEKLGAIYEAFTGKRPARTHDEGRFKTGEGGHFYEFALLFFSFIENNGRSKNLSLKGLIRNYLNCIM